MLFSFFFFLLRGISIRYRSVQKKLPIVEILHDLRKGSTFSFAHLNQCLFSLLYIANQTEITLTDSGLSFLLPRLRLESA